LAETPPAPLDFQLLCASMEQRLFWFSSRSS
jgi:hypothetical protein